MDSDAEHVGVLAQQNFLVYNRMPEIGVGVAFPYAVVPTLLAIRWPESLAHGVHGAGGFLGLCLHRVVSTQGGFGIHFAFWDVGISSSRSVTRSAYSFISVHTVGLSGRHSQRRMLPSR